VCLLRVGEFGTGLGSECVYVWCACGVCVCGGVCGLCVCVLGVCVMCVCVWVCE